MTKQTRCHKMTLQCRSQCVTLQSPTAQLDRILPSHFPKSLASSNNREEGLSSQENFVCRWLEEQSESITTGSGSAFFESTTSGITWCAADTHPNLWTPSQFFRLAFTNRRWEGILFFWNRKNGEYIVKMFLYEGNLNKVWLLSEESSFLKSGTKSESDLEEPSVGEITTGKKENIWNAGKFPEKNATDVVKPSTSCSIPIRCFSQEDELAVDKSASIPASTLSQGHISKPSQVVGISNQTAEPVVCCCSAKQANIICTCQSGNSSISASVSAIRPESGKTVRKRTEKCESIVQDKKRCLRSKTMKMRSATVVKTRSSSVLPVSQMSAEQVLKHCPKIGQEVRIVYQCDMGFEYVCLSSVCSGRIVDFGLWTHRSLVEVRVGTNILWGLIRCARTQGLPKPSSLRDGTLDTSPVKHQDSDWVIIEKTVATLNCICCV